MTKLLAPSLSGCFVHRRTTSCFSFLLLVILFNLGLGTASVCRAGDVEDQYWQIAPGDETVSVIVRFADRPGWDDLRDMSRQQRRRALVGRLQKRYRQNAGARLKQFKRKHAVRGQAITIKPLWLIHGAAVSAPANVVRRLARWPGIVSVRDNDVILLADPPIGGDDPNAPSEWHLTMINAPAMWARGYRGAGMVVGCIDSGVDYEHPDLVSRYRGGTNSWLDPYGEHADPFDYNDHGTAVTSLMVGGDASGAKIGVAPEAQWIAAKGFNDEGKAFLEELHQCFQFMLDPDGDPNTDDAPDVVNNSWSYSYVDVCVDEFQDDFLALEAAGIAVVFAAGNKGGDPCSSVSPGNNISAFAVGGVQQDYSMYSDSSRGPGACDERIYPDVTAPGQAVRTARRSYGGSANYKVWSGTSFSAPLTAGGVALLRSAFPLAEIEEIEAALRATAQEFGDPGPDNDYGHGVIDLDAAYLYLDQHHCPADINLDAVVDWLDMSALAAEFLRDDCTPESPCVSDVNNDQVVDLLDFALLAWYFDRVDCLVP